MELFTWKEIVEYEFIQLREEGKVVTNLYGELRSLQMEQSTTEEDWKEFYYKCQHLDDREDYPYIEPCELANILEQCQGVQSKVEQNGSFEHLYDKILGGWLARSAGCMLGKPVEGWPRDLIRELLTKNEHYPLHDYFSSHFQLPAMDEWMREQYKKCVSDSLEGMPRDDDMDYTILALKIIECYGFEFQTKDVANSWLLYVPAYMTYTAERAAYLNVCSGVEISKAAVVRNPYREWIGAQIRADLYGYINPGNPQKAAEMAYRDAALSHVKNGVYGSMYVAAMNAVSFVEQDIEQVIKAGMAYIPVKSRLYEAIQWVMEQSKIESDWEITGTQLLHRYGHYHRVHTINNAAIVTLALLYGQKDLEKTITIAAMMGLDTDCNAATAGSIVGILNGAEKLPVKWIDPLKNRIESYIAGEGTARIPDLAQRTTQCIATR